MAKRKRYYLKPASGSWSVFERGYKHVAERFCIVPQVTLSDAQKCCASLNAGNEAWRWEQEVV